MTYKVCILAAGVGSRMGEFCEHYNKVLIPVQGKPTICHIIEKFPENIEIVIAVGYKKEPLKEYLKTAYPKRKLTFVDIDPYQGEGSGPGYSLYSCHKELQCPFIHVAGDTLVKEEIPTVDSNWIGVARIENSERFCSLKLEGEKVLRIDDKVKCANKHAYIGLLGVYDYDAFWNQLATSDEVIAGESQVSTGINILLEKGLIAKTFTWFDTGTPKSFNYALENYPGGKSYQGY